MPSALRIFVSSLLAGAVGGWATFRFGTWLVERFLDESPAAFAALILGTALVSVASAVTAGVVLGRRARP